MAETVSISANLTKHSQITLEKARHSADGAKTHSVLFIRQHAGTEDGQQRFKGSWAKCDRIPSRGGGGDSRVSQRHTRTILRRLQGVKAGEFIIAVN